MLLYFVGKQRAQPPGKVHPILEEKNLTYSFFTSFAALINWIFVNWLNLKKLCDILQRRNWQLSTPYAGGLHRWRNRRTGKAAIGEATFQNRYWED